MLVVDYSAGMTKKVALACALVHAPRLLVLDEPFEAVDPVSAGTIRQILSGYVAVRRHGRSCPATSWTWSSGSATTWRSSPPDASAPPAPWTRSAAGATLEERFVDLVGGGTDVGEGLAWLRTSSD